MNRKLIIFKTYFRKEMFKIITLSAKENHMVSKFGIILFLINHKIKFV